MQNIQDKGVPVAQLRKADKVLLIKKIILLIERTCKRMNIDRNMNAEQMAYCAEDIANSMEANIYCLSLDDIQLCLEKGGRCEYGEIYNRMDQTVIFGWFKKYWEERAAAVSRCRDAEIANNNIYDAFKNDDLYNAVKMVNDKLRMEEKKPDSKPEPLRELPPFEKEVLIEWDSMPYGPTGTEFARLKQYKDEWVDFTDYREERFIEESKKAIDE